MYVYKNTSKYDRKFRAGEAGKKKVYLVKPGKEISLPVKISFGDMELVEEKNKKTKKGVD